MEQIIHKLQDMTYLSWAKTRNSSGTAGSFLKAYDEGTEGKIYYKLSNYPMCSSCGKQALQSGLLSSLPPARL